MIERRKILDYAAYRLHAQGMSYAEIARQAGVSTAVIGVRTNRAAKAIAEQRRAFRGLDDASVSDNELFAALAPLAGQVIEIDRAEPSIGEVYKADGRKGTIMQRHDAHGLLVRWNDGRWRWVREAWLRRHGVLISECSEDGQAV